MDTMLENKVVPKLRFREFDDYWIKESLRNCTIKIGSGSTPRGGDKTYTKDGEVHFIRSQNVVNNELVLTGDVFISDEINSKMKGSIVKPNDVLLNITGGSIGRSCVVPHEFSKGNVNQHVCIIRLDNQVYPYFLQPFLASQRGQKLIKRGQTGSGREGLNFQSIALFKLNLPCVEEQKKISTFLRAIDEKLQQLSKKKELIEDYKKGIMQKIFSQEIRFKDDNGNEYPNWEERRLGELCIFSKSGGTPKSTNKEYYNGNIPFLSISDMTKQGKYLNYTTKSISKEGLINSSSWIVPTDTIIYSMYASVGFVAINKIPIATSQAVINLGLNSYCDTEFIYYNLTDIKKHIHRFIETGTQGNLNAQIVKKLKIKLPTLEEQKKIANFLATIDKRIESVSNQFEKTKEFKKGLLQQMFV